MPKSPFSTWDRTSPNFPVAVVSTETMRKTPAARRRIAVTSSRSRELLPDVFVEDSFFFAVPEEDLPLPVFEEAFFVFSLRPPAGVFFFVLSVSAIQTSVFHRLSPHGQRDSVLRIHSMPVR